MKNTLLKSGLIAMVLLFVSVACKKTGTPEPTTAKPTIEWLSNPDFAPVEITGNMNVDICITAEAGIKEFVVSVDSHVLSPSISLLTTDGTPNMDLINDQKLIMMLSLFDLQLPVGDNLRDRTEVLFSLSGMIPMISDLSGQRDHDTNHIFTLNMTDNENRTLSKSLTFHYSYVE